MNYLPEVSRSWLANCKIEKLSLGKFKAKKTDKYQSIAYDLESKLYMLN